MEPVAEGVRDANAKHVLDPGHEGRTHVERRAERDIIGAERRVGREHHVGSSLADELRQRVAIAPLLPEPPDELVLCERLTDAQRSETERGRIAGPWVERASRRLKLGSIDMFDFVPALGQRPAKLDWE